MKITIIAILAVCAQTSFAESVKSIKLSGTGNGTSVHDTAPRGSKGSSDTARAKAEENLKKKFENYCTKNFSGSVSSIEITDLTETKKTSSGVDGLIISYSASVTGIARCNY